MAPQDRVLPTQDPKNVVDLSICSPKFSFKLSWRVLPQSYGSDYYPILVKLLNDPSPKIFVAPSLFKHNLPKADWQKYYVTVDDQTWSIDINNDTIKVVSEKISEAVLLAADKCIPIKKPTWAQIQSYHGIIYAPLLSGDAKKQNAYIHVQRQRKISNLQTYSCTNCKTISKKKWDGNTLFKIFPLAHLQL